MDANTRRNKQNFFYYNMYKTLERSINTSVELGYTPTIVELYGAIDLVKQNLKISFERNQEHILRVGAPLHNEEFEWKL
jgi:hypothetical protein